MKRTLCSQIRPDHLVDRARAQHPFTTLAGDLSDPVEVGIEMEYGQSEFFACSGDKKVGYLSTPLAFRCEESLHLERAAHV